MQQDTHENESEIATPRYYLELNGSFSQVKHMNASRHQFSSDVSLINMPFVPKIENRTDLNKANQLKEIILMTFQGPSWKISPVSEATGRGGDTSTGPLRLTHMR